MDFNAVWAKLHSTNLTTWIGHGIQGYVFQLTPRLCGMPAGYAAWAVALTFGHREASDILNARVEYGSWKAALKAKGEDGYFDFFAAIAGAVLAEVTIAIVK